VLGEGGFVVPPRDYFRILHDICRKHGIVFIADEVQSGIGRTGKWFASEHFGLEPDLITTAKSLGGGLPIAAVTGRAEIMDAPGVGGLGSTFAGNPLILRRRAAAIETIEKEGLLARSTAIGKRSQERARGWQKKWPLVGDVRGLGAMCAIELVPQSRYPRARRHRNQRGRALFATSTASLPSPRAPTTTSCVSSCRWPSVTSNSTRARRFWKRRSLRRGEQARRSFSRLVLWPKRVAKRQGWEDEPGVRPLRF